MSYFSDLFPCKKIVSLGINFFEIFVRFSFYCSRWDVRFVFSANRLELCMQIEAIRLMFTELYLLSGYLSTVVMATESYIILYSSLSAPFRPDEGYILCKCSRILLYAFTHTKI